MLLLRECSGFRKLFVPLLLLTFALPAQADVISFDPDGPGSDSAVNLAVLDIEQGSSLWEGYLEAGFGDEFTLHYHSRLGSMIDDPFSVIPGTGLNTDYEITAVAVA